MKSNAAGRERRRGFGRALGELHHLLRTEGDTAPRSAAAVFVGIVVGCTPLYGAHWMLCAGLATVLGLSRLKTYLAAHINNPLTAPLLLPIEFGVGRWLHTGQWPETLDGAFGDATIAQVGSELLVGSVLVGLSVGAVMALGSLVIRMRRRVAPAWDKVCHETARRYLEAGTMHWEFVRGKLRYDPLYRDLFASGALPGGGVLRDLGCGRGILFALIQVAEAAHARGDWPASWPPPPADVVLEGVERRTSLVSVARMATGARARIIASDLVPLAIEPARAILLLDVLHYLSPTDQESLIRRAGAALEPGGVMLLREPDSARPVRFLVNRWSERLCSVLRREGFRRLHYRSAAAWCCLLEAQGLVTRIEDSSHRTPFANVLIRGHRPSDPAPRTAP